MISQTRRKELHHISQAMYIMAEFLYAGGKEWMAELYEVHHSEEEQACIAQQLIAEELGLA